MEIASLAAAAVGLLSRYLSRVADQAADDAAAGVGQGVVNGLRQLYQRVRGRLPAETFAGQALSRLEDDPASEPRQDALKSALIEVLGDDGELANELEQLVEAIRRQGGDAVEITDAGVVTMKGDVTMHGRYVAGRDMTIGDATERRER